MSGYCKVCGNQHCICGFPNVKTDNVFINATYSSLGWQGGTIHQVVNEIRILKEREKVIEQMVELIIKESSICEPDINYKLKDVIDDNCLNCSNINICKFIIAEGLK